MVQSERVGPRWGCLGYAAFVKALDNKDTARWFTTLLADLNLQASNQGRNGPVPLDR